MGHVSNYFILLIIKESLHLVIDIRNVQLTSKGRNVAFIELTFHTGSQCRCYKYIITLY